ncbi:MAG: right-handed parallel beta-helix repeat-containing protein, partial [Candidatus Glassbacteria bacterium]
EFDEFICGAPGGWFQDKATGQLYLKLVSGADPNRIAVQIASLDAGFHLSGADCVLIEGFEVRDYGRNTGGSGIRVEQSAWNVIRRCAVHGMQSQVELAGRRAEGNLVEGCELRDSSIPLWPWQMTKSHDEEGGGVMSTGGRGNVVRGCTIHDLFDGLAPSYWDSLWNEAYNCDWDVHGNGIYNTRDDIIEPEGPCINFRFWNNVCHSLFVGVSLTPINVGPTYVLYNLIYDLQFKNFKYGGSDPGWCYILHNTVCSINRGHDLMVISQPFKGQIYRNNILWATGWAMWSSRKPLAAENDLDYDCWYSSDIDWFRGYTGLAHKRLFRFEGREYFFIKDFTEAFGWEKHGLQAHPRLADPGSGDFRLLPDSPCLDRGVVLPNINDRFVGAGPDLGAFERGSANRSRFPLGEVR